MRRTSHDETWAEIRASVNGSTRSSCLVLLSLGHLAWWRRSSCRVLHGAQFLKYAGLADHQCFLHKDPKLHQLLLELRPGNMVRDEVKVGSVQIRQCKMLKAVAGTTASTLPVSQTLSPKLANKVNSRCVLMVAASYLKREVQLEVCMPKTCGGPEMSSLHRCSSVRPRWRLPCACSENWQARDSSSNCNRHAAEGSIAAISNVFKHAGRFPVSNCWIGTWILRCK